MASDTLNHLKEVLSNELRPEVFPVPDVVRVQLLETLASSSRWKGMLSKACNEEQGIPSSTAARLRLLEKLWDITNHHAQLFVFLTKATSTSELADIATDYYLISQQTDSYELSSKQWNEYRTRLFAADPTALLRGLVKKDVIAATAEVKEGLLRLFDDAVAWNFNIAKDSARPFVTKAQSRAPKEYPPSEEVVRTFNAIQRLQAVVVQAEQIGTLLAVGYASAHQVANASTSKLRKQLQGKIKPGDLKRIYDQAVLVDTRNEQTWISLLKSRTEDLAPATASTTASRAAQEKEELIIASTWQNISLETLFKEVQSGSCDHCSSVISPSAYFVDLLRMLHDTPVLKPRSDTVNPTLLSEFLDRRPDLALLELSCSNTNNLIPYIHLVHEVLQSFALSLTSNGLNPTTYPVPPSQAIDPALGEEDPDVSFSFELHEKISQQVYPIASFPANLATDAVRLLLAACGCKRLEVKQIFGSAYRISSKLKGFENDGTGLLGLKDAQHAMHMAYAAENLGLLEEDFRFITGESFVSRSTLELELGSLGDDEYEKLLEISSVSKKWGYENDDDMLKREEIDKLGLTFVEDQLLPRSGLSFQDLVDVLKTQFLGCRLVLTPAFSLPYHSGELKDLRLRSSLVEPDNEGSLTADVCAPLISFIKLYRKLGWSISDLDAAIGCIHRSDTSLGSETTISPEVINRLSLIKDLSTLTGLEVKLLLPLWADIDTNGPKSLYAMLFLRKGLPPDQKRFLVDEDSLVLCDGMKLRDGINTLTTALGVSSTEFAALLAISNLTNDSELDLANVSTIYRYLVLSKAMDITPEELKPAWDKFGRKSGLLDSPLGTLEGLRRWKLVKSFGIDLIGFLERLPSPKSVSSTVDPRNVLDKPHLKLAASVFKDGKVIPSALLETVVTEDTRDYSSVISSLLTEVPLFKEGKAVARTALQLLEDTYITSSKDSFQSGYLTPDIRGEYIFDFEGVDVEVQLSSTEHHLTISKTADASHSGPIILEKDQPYTIQADFDIRCLQWTIPQSGGLVPLKDRIVASKVLHTLNTVIRRVRIVAEMVKRLDFSPKEIHYFSRHLKDTTWFNLVDPGMPELYNLAAFATLRARFVKRGSPSDALVKFLSSLEEAESNVSEQLAKAANTSSTVISDILMHKYPRIGTSQLRKIICKLYEITSILDILDFTARVKTPNSLLLLFTLAEPLHPLHRSQESLNATELRSQLRKLWLSGGKEAKEGYSAVIDKIVERSNAVLIPYLLNHDWMKTRHLYDADSLFEYFLIDVQMGPGQRTSRMKQAISTVQLYVQRCVLGLEINNSVTSDLIDQSKWEWMRSYQLWEANRKVFLYPENWIDPTLRDDKSELFKDLESQILQSNLNRDTISQIVKTYIYGVNELADLDILAYLWDTTQAKGKRTMHLFGKTRNSPYLFYYRKLDIVGEDNMLFWSPWQKMDLDIPTFEVNADGTTLEKTGSYLLPTIRQGRLYVFIPQILLKTLPTKVEPQSMTEMASKQVSNNASKFWEVSMGWSELRNGKWSPKRVSQAKLSVWPIKEERLPDTYATPQQASLAKTTTPTEKIPSPTIPKPAAPTARQGLDQARLPSIDSFKFWIRSASAEGITALAKGVQDVLHIDMECWVNTSPSGQLVDSTKYELQSLSCPLGRFQMREYDITAVDFTQMPTEYAETGKQTVPTRFSKLEWDDTTTGVEWKPRNKVYHGVSDNEPALANVKQAGVKKRQLTWTMSFDDTQFKQPTGLVVDINTPTSGLHSYLVFPVLKLDESTGESGVSASLNNALAPFFMRKAATEDGIEDVFRYISSDIDEQYRFDAFGLRRGPWFHELAAPYALYNWELGFHIVSLLMERLLATQQLDLALHVARYVFDPTINGNDPQRCWNFPPFKDPQVNQSRGPAKIAGSMDPKFASQLESAVQEWTNHPFQPHASARNWPISYMKRIVRKYIEILIASGDEQFRIGTLESMPLAIQRYIEASHLFGAAPKTYPRLGKTKPKTFKDLQNLLSTFSNATVDLELDFPFSLEPDWRGYPTLLKRGDDQQPGLLGFVRTGYFCVPPNPDLVALREKIDDRLYKIRNCQDMNGKGVTLRLFEPSLDPGALVAARAAGQSLSSFVNDADYAMPNYRFYYLLQKSFELVGELRAMGESFLAAKEKKDAEMMNALRSSQEIAVSAISLEIKKQAKDEAEASLAVLQDTRRSHETRLSFYLRLIGETDSAPSFGQDWQDIQQTIEKPTMDDLRMSSNESIEFDLAAEAAALSLTASTLDTVAAGLMALPKVQTNIEPMGMGVSMHFDASNVAQFMSGTSGVMKLFSQLKSEQSGRAARKAQLIRQLQDRRLQANIAGHDIMNADKQIKAQHVRIQMADNEIAQQEKQIAHAKEMDLWCRDKYTNEKLYSWMDNQLSKLYRDTYTLAAELARKAKKAFEYEKGRGSMRQLRDTGYWDQSKDGLLSAQNLYLDLKRMENAYMECRSHEYEISKSISLRQIQPRALLELRESGSTTFEIPEILFDLDFPGHYLRRIKSVSLSLPCIIGPYTSIACTLSLTKHVWRVQTAANDGRDYLQKGDSDARFRFDCVPIDSVAISDGHADTGQFEISFNGERYGPFEGAGVISSWKLELPTAVRQFDYNTISDVILQIKYTSCSDGKLKVAATDAVKRLVTGIETRSLYTLLDLKNDFGNEWRAMKTQPQLTNDGLALTLFTLKNMTAKLPFWTKAKAVYAKEVTLFVVAEADAAVPDFSLHSYNNIAFKAGPKLDDCQLFALTPDKANPLPLGEWKIAFKSPLSVERLFMVVEYQIGVHK